MASLTTTTTENLNELLLLTIQSVCNHDSVRIPFDKVAQTMGHNTTEGAIVQHLAKLRTRRLEADKPVPPPLRRGRDRVTKSPETKALTTKIASFKVKPEAGSHEEPESGVPKGDTCSGSEHGKRTVRKTDKSPESNEANTQAAPAHEARDDGMNSAQKEAAADKLKSDSRVVPGAGFLNLSGDSPPKTADVGMSERKNLTVKLKVPSHKLASIQTQSAVFDNAMGHHSSKVANPIGLQPSIAGNAFGRYASMGDSFAHHTSVGNAFGHYASMGDHFAHHTSVGNVFGHNPSMGSNFAHNASMMGNSMGHHALMDDNLARRPSMIDDSFGHYTPMGDSAIGHHTSMAGNSIGTHSSEHGGRVPHPTIEDPFQGYHGQVAESPMGVDGMVGNEMPASVAPSLMVDPQDYVGDSFADTFATNPSDEEMQSNTFVEYSDFLFPYYEDPVSQDDKTPGGTMYYGGSGSPDEANISFQKTEDTLQ